ncbi:hypothetical protein [Corallococcus llansteffanensis]|uniref:Uncharacterized protein n=1 Tax=Corallococcus llansteffanensis TaxID=2316731 RepID=A0A3A8P0L9_9BACT|nr:hypothetical protein [Corallococcus llansteffanensis]RKH49883.1 hypothetical protein D7V93_31265 [Corallococcus llansteffanensis]
MNPRTLSLLITLAACVFAVGTAVWLAWPGPDLTAQADLSEQPVQLRLDASCRDRPCPQGQRCAEDAPGDVPSCHPFVGPACLDAAPCAKNQDCLRGFAEPSLDTQAFECRARCDDRTPCAPGLSCDAASGYCFQPCDGDGDCAAPERCHALHPRAPQRGCGFIAEGLPTFLRR